MAFVVALWVPLTSAAQSEGPQPEAQSSGSADQADTASAECKAGVAEACLRLAEEATGPLRVERALAVCHGNEPIIAARGCAIAAESLRRAGLEASAIPLEARGCELDPETCGASRATGSWVVFHGAAATITLATGARCHVPCGLSLAPGRNRVLVEGSSSFQDELVFGEGGQRVRVEQRSRFTMLAVGLSVGATLAVFSASYLASATGRDPNVPMLVMGSLAAAGSVTSFVFAGIGIATLGRNRLTLEKGLAEGRQSALAPSAPLRVSLVAAPLRGGGALGLVVSF